MQDDFKPVPANDQDFARLEVEHTLFEAHPELDRSRLQKRSDTIYADAILLARCAKSECLITYASAILLRGHGNAQNGQWLDDVYLYAIRLLSLPELTTLVVNKSTKLPSPEAFNARRSTLSKVHIENVPLEQKRCMWFKGYEETFGILAPIPREHQLGRIHTPEPRVEREISRAVGNAIARAQAEGKEQVRLGKEYPHSLSRVELAALTTQLWEAQRGRCALTGLPFDLRSAEEGGMQDDRVSLDRLENTLGYSEGNIQLVTQFANRARGMLSVEEARRRLVQFQ